MLVWAKVEKRQTSLPCSPNCWKAQFVFLCYHNRVRARQYSLYDVGKEAYCLHRATWPNPRCSIIKNRMAYENASVPTTEFASLLTEHFFTKYKNWTHASHNRWLPRRARPSIRKGGQASTAKQVLKLKIRPDYRENSVQHLHYNQYNWRRCHRSKSGNSAIRRAREPSSVLRQTYFGPHVWHIFVSCYVGRSNDNGNDFRGGSYLPFSNTASALLWTTYLHWSYD